MRSTIALVACAFATAAMATGCTIAEGDPAAPSSGVGLASEQARQLSPSVDNPRDIRAYGDRPCDVFTTEQLAGFGFDRPPDRTYTLPSGAQTCVWTDSGRNGQLSATPYAGWDVLERTYLNRGSLPVFEPLEIAGSPAVVHQPGPVATCNVTVGLAERQGLDVVFTDLRQPYEDPCGAARAAAEVAVGNLPPLR